FTDVLEHLVQGNKDYVHLTEPSEFVALAQGQTPQILWIGSADSRIPETTVCHCKPGEIFVHHNIANTFHAHDFNVASDVEYTVMFLEVEKIVVCGHTQCGGVFAALSDHDLGQTLNPWLHPIRVLRRTHILEQTELPNGDARSAHPVILNVQNSSSVVEGFPMVEKAICELTLTSHGLICDIRVGKLRIVN
ncbi:carbonic anhydrase, partial [Plenodomus tracheiphilus IPT5]